MNSVGIYGWNGKFNVGDDAMTRVMCEYFSAQNVNTIKLLAEGSRLPLLPAAVKGYTGYEKINTARYIHRVLNPLLYLPDFTNVDLMLFGGGSIFHSTKNTNFFGRMAERTKKKGGKAGALGVSVGPFKGSSHEDTNRKFLDSLDFVVVRDQHSLDILKKWDVQTSYDLGVDVAVLFSKYVSFTPQVVSHKRIGVSLRAGFENKTQLQSLANVINQLAKNSSEKIEVMLFVFCENETDGDLHLLKEFEKLLSRQLTVSWLRYSKKTEDFYATIASCSLMFATRLHAAILSYSVAVPVVVLSYHEKCVEFAKYIGLNEKSLVDFNRFKEYDLLDTAQQLIHDQKINYSLPLATAQESAMKHFQFISKL